MWLVEKMLQREVKENSFQVEQVVESRARSSKYRAPGCRFDPISCRIFTTPSPILPGFDMNFSSQQQQSPWPLEPGSSLSVI